MMAILKFNMVATRVRFIVESLLKTILQGSLQVYFRAVGGGGYAYHPLFGVGVPYPHFSYTWQKIAVTDPQHTLKISIISTITGFNSGSNLRLSNVSYVWNG